MIIKYDGQKWTLIRGDMILKFETKWQLEDYLDWLENRRSAA